MTGYGRGEAAVDTSLAVAEIRSVNHRFLDLKIRGSGLGMALEEKCRAKVKSALSRGSVTVTLRIDTNSGGRALKIDQTVAKAAFIELTKLATSIGLQSSVDLSLLCSLPGVVVVSDEMPSDSLASASLAALDAALVALIEMRAREGEILARDIHCRLANLSVLTDSLESLAKHSPKRAQKRLAERLERLLRQSSGLEVEIDSGRLAQEIAVLADRLDVTEELVRVRSHLEQVATLLADEPKSIGRRLDFLVQELGREFNTIASKSQSADISGTVVEAKAELEKVREQVQNIE